jgi:hypothetical protein
LAPGQILLHRDALGGHRLDGVVVGQDQRGALLLVDVLADPQVGLCRGVRAGDRAALAVGRELEAQHLAAGGHLGGQRLADVVGVALEDPRGRVDHVVTQRDAVLGGHVDGPVGAAGRQRERVGDHGAQHHDGGRPVRRREHEEIPEYGHQQDHHGARHQAPAAQRDPHHVREADDPLPARGDGISHIHESSLPGPVMRLHR